MATIDGHCDIRFRRVRDLLAANVGNRLEVGASLYVNLDGEEVLNLWGGWREREEVHPWTAETIVNVFSCTKTVTSLAILMLHDRGALDLFAPVARYWPEFAQNGKEGVEVRHLISHTAGIPAWEPPFSLADAQDVENATMKLARQAPWWKPGARGSYHASTFGHLNSELVRRVTGRSLREFISEEIAGPLQARFQLGLHEAEPAEVATVYPADDAPRSPAVRAAGGLEADGLKVEQELSARTRLGSFSGTKRDPLALFNSPEWRRTEFGGSSGHGNAQGLGRIMSTLALGGTTQGQRLLSPTTVDLIFSEQANGIDAYYMKPIRWGLGYALASLDDNARGPLPFLRRGPKTCFWYGTGGSMALADADRRVTVAYAMNQCQSGRKSLNGQYYDAVYDCLSSYR